MAVIVKFIVVRDGVEKMTFTTKKEADAYDRMLDIADNLHDYIEAAGLGIEGADLEELSLFLAKNRDHIVAMLKGTTPEAVKKHSEKTAASKHDKKTTDKKES